jgi:hypothetical protein
MLIIEVASAVLDDGVKFGLPGVSGLQQAIRLDDLVHSICATETASSSGIIESSLRSLYSL